MECLMRHVRFAMLALSLVLLGALVAGLLPHEIAMRSRQPSGTLTLTGEVPARMAIPALR